LARMFVEVMKTKRTMAYNNRAGGGIPTQLIFVTVTKMKFRNQGRGRPQGNTGGGVVNRAKNGWYAR